MVAAESGAERVSGDGKNDRPRGVQRVASRAHAQPQGQETAAPCEERGETRKETTGRMVATVLQTTYDKHLSSSATQGKSVTVPEDMPKHPEPFFSSRQQPLPESAQQHGGASQKCACRCSPGVPAEQLSPVCNHARVNTSQPPVPPLCLTALALRGYQKWLSAPALRGYWKIDIDSLS
ncbi:hypothetical protein MRX96_020079 [Rhipicephalus microplus]